MVIATGSAQVLVTGISNSEDLIAIDSTSIYYADGSAIKKISKTGGTITTLVTGIVNPTGLAVDP